MGRKSPSDLGTGQSSGNRFRNFSGGPEGRCTRDRYPEARGGVYHVCRTRWDRPPTPRHPILNPHRLARKDRGATDHDPEPSVPTLSDRNRPGLSPQSPRRRVSGVRPQSYPTPVSFRTRDRPLSTVGRLCQPYSNTSKYLILVFRPKKFILEDTQR